MIGCDLRCDLDVLVCGPLAFNVVTVITLIGSPVGSSAPALRAALSDFFSRCLLLSRFVSRIIAATCSEADAENCDCGNTTDNPDFLFRNSFSPFGEWSSEPPFAAYLREPRHLEVSDFVLEESSS